MSPETSSKQKRLFAVRYGPAIVKTAVILTFAVAPTAFCVNGEHWVGTWSTAVHEPEPLAGITNVGFQDQTLRQIVHTSIGGSRVRIRLSTFASSGVAVGAAHIAISNGESTIIPGSDRALTFGGSPTIAIPPGATVLSDGVNLDVPSLGDLAVSIWVVGSSGPATWHSVSMQRSYVSPPGDFTASNVMPVESTRDAWFWLAGVDVMSSRHIGAVVTFGDSVTDGTNSSPNTNNRWPDHLALRLIEQRQRMGVLNAGLTGNRLLHDVLGPNTLARFDRDVLTQTGVTHVIVLVGNNDIGVGWEGGIDPSNPVSAYQIIQGYIQLIERAHNNSLRIYGGTLPPFEGAGLDNVLGDFYPYFSRENETKRQTINAWIRTSGAFDGVIDFDAALRDPKKVTRMLPAFDSGDHLHPNDAGYKALANAIDLMLLAQR